MKVFTTGMLLLASIVLTAIVTTRVVHHQCVGTLWSGMVGRLERDQKSAIILSGLLRANQTEEAIRRLDLLAQASLKEMDRIRREEPDAAVEEEAVAEQARKLKAYFEEHRLAVPPLVEDLASSE